MVKGSYHRWERGEGSYHRETRDGKGEGKLILASRGSGRAADEHSWTWVRSKCGVLRRRPQKATGLLRFNWASASEQPKASGTRCN